MNPEWAAIAVTLLLFVAGSMASVIWNASRVNGAVVQLTRSVANLDRTLDKLAESLTVESRINAVQDARLETHTKRLDAHDLDIAAIRRNNQ